MFSIVATEFLKLNKKKSILLYLHIPFLYLLCFLYTASKVGVEVVFLDFRFLLIESYFFILLLHTLAIGIIGITFFGREYNLHLKKEHVSILPFFLSNIFTILMISVLLMFAATVELTILGALISNKGFTFQNIFFVFMFYMLVAITLPLGLMPVFFVAARCRQHSVVSVVSLFLYLSLAFFSDFGGIKITGSIWNNMIEYLYPLGSVAMIQKDCLYKTMPFELLGWTESSTYIPLCILCLLAFTLFFIALSAFSFKKRIVSLSPP